MEDLTLRMTQSKAVKSFDWVGDLELEIEWSNGETEMFDHSTPLLRAIAEHEASLAKSK